MNNEFGSTSSQSGTAGIKESVQKLADQGGETVGVLKGRASELADGLKQQYSDTMHRALDFVQERPLAAVGLAVGLGYFSRTILRLGMLSGVAYLALQLAGRKAAQGGEGSIGGERGQGLQADSVSTY